ncbi:MAG TPA: hypothetical protein VNI57_02110, partial [Candidatus Saccharimonadales bacterium]|nr:hypothetical protein [Candidatus Saccharimonadales bacterium]
MESNPVVSVLAEIAETASESVELQEVFNRVAAAVRRLIPFDNMGVVRIIDGRFAVLHATTAECTVDDRICSGPEPLTSWSPRVRPRPEPIPRVDDAEAEMDASFQMDAIILGSGVKSALWAPFRPAEAFRGGVFLSSNRTHAFTDEHQAILDPIAALLGSGVEHWRIWDAERARRERLDQLESILGPLSRSLDVREVFDHISEAVRPILPHDLLVLTDIDVTSRVFRVVAVSGEADISAPADPIRLSELETDRRSLEFEIYRDMPQEIEPSTERNQILLATGMRSWMKVPVWRDGVVRGAVGFMHREPSRFG